MREWDCKRDFCYLVCLYCEKVRSAMCYEYTFNRKKSEEIRNILTGTRCSFKKRRRRRKNKAVEISC